MSSEELKILHKSTETELERRQRFVSLMNKHTIPENEILMNMGLFLRRQLLSRIFFMNEMYQRIINVHGVIMEFGVRWGQNLALFENFRGMYEPYNYTRKLIGFDTFEGFPSVHDKDGKADVIAKGAFSVTKGFEDYLTQVLDFHESESPIPHIKKHELCKGDAIETVEKYLKDHPETIIAMAYFDFDIYEPTKRCLTAIKDRLTKGSVIGFDELNHPEYPGETLALKETLGLTNYRIIRSPLVPTSSYIVIE
jgi:hypothetical protein